MAAKSSVRVTDWKKLGRFVATALLGPQGVRVAEKMLGKVLPAFTGEGAPDFLVNFRSLGLHLRAELARLVDADDLLFDANAKLTALRDQRDDLYKRLAELISAIRSSIAGQFKSPLWDQLGFEDRTANSLGQLLRQAVRILNVFGRDSLDELLGEAKFDSRFDPRPNVLELQPVTQELEDTIDAIDDAVRVRDQLKVDRDRVLEEVYSATVYTAQTFEAHCRLAGEKELADRVRPTVRTATATSGEATDTPTTEPPPSEEPVVTPPQAGEDVGDAIVTGGASDSA